MTVNFIRTLPRDRQAEVLELVRSGKAEDVICNTCNECSDCPMKGMTNLQALVVSFYPIAKTVVTQMAPLYLREDAISELMVQTYAIVDKIIAKGDDLDNYQQYVWMSYRGHLLNLIKTDGVIRRDRHGRCADMTIFPLREEDLAQPDPARQRVFVEIIDMALETEQERCIFELVSQRYKGKEIAEMLNVSPQYITKVRSRIADRAHTLLKKD